MVRTHPQCYQILTQINEEQSLDETLAVLCRNLGLDPCEWSRYTGSLNPPALTFDRPYNLSRLDARLSRFDYRFGTIIVISGSKIVNDLRVHFNIRGITEWSEYDLLVRTAQTVSDYRYSKRCIVIGEVGNHETLLLMENGAVKAMTINSAPLCHIAQIFIVGRLADRFPPHLRHGLGERFLSSEVIQQYYRRSNVTVLRSCNINGEETALQRWHDLTNDDSFICFERGLGTLRTTRTNLVLVRQSPMEDRFSFVLRANAYQNGQYRLEG